MRMTEVVASGKQLKVSGNVLLVSFHSTSCFFFSTSSSSSSLPCHIYTFTAYDSIREPYRFSTRQFFILHGVSFLKAAQWSSFYFRFCLPCVNLFFGQEQKKRESSFVSIYYLMLCLLAFFRSGGK